MATSFETSFWLQHTNSVFLQILVSGGRRRSQRLWLVLCFVFDFPEVGTPKKILFTTSESCFYQIESSSHPPLSRWFKSNYSTIFHRLATSQPFLIPWYSYLLWAIGECKRLKSQVVDLSKGKTNRPEEEVYILQCSFCCYPCPVCFVIIHVWFVLLPSMCGKRPSIPYPSSRGLREPFSKLPAPVTDTFSHPEAVRYESFDCIVEYII